MSTDFTELTSLLAEWQSLQPLKPEDEARLWKKLRLDWNYHSNHIEGNTLTYGETELLLLHDRTHGNHSHREYLEMKAHDVAIEHVRTLAANRSPIIAETDIRDLNRIILKEPFWKTAQTADGQPTRKEVIPGQYKTSPNNVRTATGDMFYFASVEDTPPKMQALTAWLRQELETPSLHSMAFAAKLHHDFVRIHPFDDGNGRVARLLVNYVLMRCDYLPVIVRTDDKANYLTALRLADAGDIAPLTDYVAALAAHSLRLGIRAGKGEPVADPSDIEKEIEIFIRNQHPHQERNRPRSPEAIREVVELGLRTLVQQVHERLQKLRPLFADLTVSMSPAAAERDLDPAEALQVLVAKPNPRNQFQLVYQFQTYTGQAPAPFNLNSTLTIHFDDLGYRVTAQGVPEIRKLYSEPVTADEIDSLSTGMLAHAFECIKAKAHSA